MDDELLPGEADDEAQIAAVKQWGLKLIADSLAATDDDYILLVLAMYHEEWEKRTGERWVLAE